MGLSPFIYVNLTSATCCFIFLIFLFLAYFTKKNMDNIENRIYRVMIIDNMICVIIYVLFYSTDIIAYMTKSSVMYSVVYFFSKIAPIPIIAWCSFLAFYLAIIINEKNKEVSEKIVKNEKKIWILLTTVISIIAVFNFLEKSVLVLETGIESKLLLVMNISLNSFFLVDIILLIRYGNRLPKRKALPLYMIIPFSVIALVLGVTGVQVVCLFVIVTAMDHLMYHTIENPDLKLINQLKLAKDQAEKSNHAKGDFLSSMSHEIRTPLNAIVGLSQMIKESDNLEEIRNDSDDIIIASQNLLEIVNGILDINKLESNEMEIIEDEYKPREVFENIIKLINIKIGTKPLELRTIVESEVPEVLYGDKEKLKQIITNLLTNAVKYTEKGFVDFNVFCENNKDKCKLTISVKDTGRGISDEQKEKLFTKFNRLDSDKDSDIEGTGLGLAITKSLVELFEGAITVESILGQGSTFTVIITQKIVKLKEKEEIL